VKDVASTPIAVSARGTSMRDYVALTKPRLNLLVVATSAAGYYLGAAAAPDLIAMAEAVAGTAFVAGGASVLNQVYERDTDALMRRTRQRPLPDGRVATGEASVFGVALAGAGLAILGAFTNVLAAALALATLVTYLIV
jgi:protoheme IX farnesyltransferase